MNSDTARDGMDNALERLAAFEHAQWADWTRHFLENLTPENVARWRGQAALPYDQLTEREREKDRVWARGALDAIKNAADGVILEGRHLRFRKRAGWEFVERRTATGIVAVLAVTADRRLVLVEQFRPPVARPVVELPAGLAGDIAGAENEALADAARRELLEETGYLADRMEFLGAGPASAGLCGEIITFLRAVDARQVEKGGGDATEAITVHAVPLDRLRTWIEERQAQGALVDYKIQAALWMAGIGA